ncbi:Rhomboid family protein [Rubripirellula tenax]|uniref:Rhomboid family protein n=1 Tax=Rubripirellula tenax TaxID=2528015 RepID=A0A5C6FKB7_9BACT|nr:rhomboid family intramembrane serine protease [Rubripirellula tenax]TWU60447.1 Rhomboid family protein [Rubripirellula tenax]
MKTQAYPVVIFLLVMWLIRIVDMIIPADLNQFGLQPRMLHGVPGIMLSPFLHQGFGHLISNTIPLAILVGLTIASRHRAWLIVVAIVISSGVLLWIFGRSANHIGASGLVFGLIAYLITVGIREKQLVSVAIALMVGFFFGGTLVFGVIPSFGSAISWDGHLCGAISGVVIGIATTQKAQSFF